MKNKRFECCKNEEKLKLSKSKQNTIKCKWNNGCKIV